MDRGSGEQGITKECITDNLLRLLEQGFLTEAEIFLWTSGAATASEVYAQKLLRDSSSFERNALYKLSGYLRNQLANSRFMEYADSRMGPYKAVMTSQYGYSADSLIAMAAQQVMCMAVHFLLLWVIGHRLNGPFWLNFAVTLRDPRT